MTTGHYCEAHKPKSPRTDIEVRKLRSGRRWQNFINWYRRRNPLCRDPFRSHRTIVPMDHIHHIKPVRTHPQLCYDDRNCVPLCYACHAKIEAMDHAGEPTEHLFRTRKVTLVYGPPCGGKSTYVLEHMQPGDVILDMASLMASVSGQQEHSVRPELWPFVRAAFYAVVSEIERDKTITAWVILTAPRREERTALAQRLGASTVLMSPGADVCIARSAARQQSTDWTSLISEWHSAYESD